MTNNLAKLTIDFFQLNCRNKCCHRWRIFLVTWNSLWYILITWPKIQL